MFIVFGVGKQPYYVVGITKKEGDWISLQQ